MQAPAVVAQPPAPLQITEYVQDIYPPAQVYTEQVPVVCSVNHTELIYISSLYYITLRVIQSTIHLLKIQV